MNVIFVLIDSLNRHMLEPYGGTEGATPNFKRFSEKAIRFDNHYVGSLPCMPARREIFTGRKDFLWRRWGHLEAFDDILPQVISKNGYKTQIVTDHYHYWRSEANGYIESFQGMELIRGHENDNWKTDPVDEVPDWAEAINRYRPGQGTIYYKNVKDFREERDFFPAKVMTSAADWLGANHEDQPYYLHVESFDVHEPFHCPEPYRSMWTDHLDPKYNCWPPYQNDDKRELFFDKTDEQELDFIRGQYKGKVSMVDKWFGHLLDTLDRLSVWKDTAVIVTTDHGHDLGQHRQYGKQFPHWDSHANIPLFIYHPDFKDKKEVNTFTSTVDLYSTILDFLQIKSREAPHSRSMLPLIDGSRSTIREALLYGIFGKGPCCTDGTFNLYQGFDNKTYPLYQYTGRLQLYENMKEVVTSGHYIPDVPYPVWKIPFPSSEQHPSWLISKWDPIGQEQNLMDQEPRKVKQMRELMVELMREEGCPPEQFVRVGLSN